MYYLYLLIIYLNKQTYKDQTKIISFIYLVLSFLFRFSCTVDLFILQTALDFIYLISNRSLLIEYKIDISLLKPTIETKHILKFWKFS